MTRPNDTDIDNALSPPNTVITTESQRMSPEKTLAASAPGNANVFNTERALANQ